MANRFTGAGQHQSQSQFVPRELPLDMMAQALGTRQQAYENRLQDLYSKRAAFNQQSIGKDHDEYVKQKEAEFDEFVNTSANSDLSSPDYLRQYAKFTSDFANDEKLQTVAARFNNYAANIAEGKDLRSNSKYNAARDYRTQQRIAGIMGDDANFNDVLGDIQIGEAVDVNKEYENIFNDLKASGSEGYVKDLQEMYFKQGWSGVSGSRLRGAADKALGLFMDTEAGRQELMEYNMRVGQGTIDPDEIKSSDFVLQRMLDTGSRFEYGNSTESFAAGYTTAQQADVDEHTAPQDPILMDEGSNADAKSDWQDSFGIAGASHGSEEEVQAAKLSTATEQIGLLEGVQSKIMGGNINWERKEGSYLPYPEDMFSNEELEYISKLPGGVGQRLIDGETVEVGELKKVDDFMSNNLNRWYNTELVAQNDLMDMHTTQTAAVENGLPSSQYGGHTATDLMREFYGENYTTGDINRDIEIAHDKSIDDLNDLMRSTYGEDGERSYNWHQEALKRSDDNANIVRQYDRGDQDANAFVKFAGYISASGAGSSNMNQYTRDDAVGSVGEFSETMSRYLMQDLESGVINQEQFMALNDAVEKRAKSAYTELARVDIEEALWQAGQVPDEANAVRDYYNLHRGGTQESLAVVEPKTSTYAQRQSDGKFKDVERPGVQLERTMNANPNSGSFEYFTEDNIPIPKDEILEGSIKLISSDLSDPSNYSNDATVTVSLKTMVMQPNKQHLAEVEQGVRAEGDIDQKEYAEYQKVMVRVKDGDLSTTYKDELAKQYENVFLANPNTSTGQRALEISNTIRNPHLNTAANNMERMKEGQTTTFRHQMPVIEPNMPVRMNDYVTAEVTKDKGGTYSLVLKAKDASGKYVPISDESGIPYQSPTDLTYHLINLTREMQNEAAYYQRKAIQHPEF